MIEIECWPRWVDPSTPGAEQYAGWPVRLHQQANYGREAQGWLPRIVVKGIADPVVQVVEDGTGEVVYTIRIKGKSYHPKVFTLGPHTLVVGEPDLGLETRFEGLVPVKDPDDSPLLPVVF